jgi:hypothetical protein
MVWGRDEIGTGDMWNSNSVIAWLVARSGIPTDMISPPPGGRAPGWETGLVTARYQQPSDEKVHSITAPRKSGRTTSTTPILPDAFDLRLRSGSRRNWRTQQSLGTIDGQARVLDDAETECSRHERVTDPPIDAERGGQINKARRTSFA